MPVLLCFLLLLASPQEPSPEQQATGQLAKVRRIYVDILTGGDAALKIRDLLMASLQSSKRFVITEDPERADAILRGAADDKPFVDTFQSSEGLNAHTQVGGNLGGSSRTTRAPYMGVTIGENENRKTEERKHEAIATVRLVNKDGDVIWSVTAESLGGKFLGASADVADKIAKRLVTDFLAAKKTAAGQPGVPAQVPPANSR